MEDEQLQKWNKENMDQVRSALVEAKARLVGTMSAELNDEETEIFQFFDIGGRTLVLQTHAAEQGFELLVPLTDEQLMPEVVKAIEVYASPLDPLDHFWIDNFTAERPDGRDGFASVKVCALCDQTGVIQTEKYGSFFCLCPNGRARREHVKGVASEPSVPR